MMNHIKHIFVLFLSVVTLGAAGQALAGHVVNTQNGVAVKGHDVVAYHSLEAGAPAVKGTSSFSSHYEGATYHFANAGNKEKFDKNPGKFAPQYGGYCAYAMALGGDLVDTDPNAWAVVNGKLYLNVNKTVQGFWAKDIPGFIAKADAKWAAKHSHG